MKYIYEILSSTGGSPPFKPDNATPNNTNEPYIDFLNYALGQDFFAQVLTTSYGDDEQTVRFTRLNVLTWNVIYPSGATRLR